MQKTGSILFFLTLAVSIQAADLVLDMASTGGSTLSPYVTIADKGIDGAAAYHKATRSVSGASDGTCVVVRTLPFGDYYGKYNAVTVEYILEDPAQEGFIEFSLDNSAYVFASVPVVASGNSDLQTAHVNFDVNVTGQHKLYIRWKQTKASLKTVILKENVPVAQVKAVRTTSPVAIAASTGNLRKLTGKHRLKMVWKNQGANVYSVRLKSSLLGMEEIVYQDQVQLETFPDAISVSANQLISSIDIYAVTGSLYRRISTKDYQINIPLEKGMYIVVITTDSGYIYRKKTIII